MYILCCHIIISNNEGELAFTYTNEVTIESSWKTLTDTATIRMPRRIHLKNTIFDDINQVITRGSRVRIDLGYDGNMHREFTGYVARIDAKTPFLIECEDEMWKLKQTNFTKTWGKVKLKDVIAHIYRGRTKVIDMELNGYRIVKKSAAKVLEDLKSLGIYSYFRWDEALNDQVLFVELGGYNLKPSRRLTYNFNKNITENDLKYRIKEDMKIKVTATSFSKDNKKTEVVVGDPDGELRSLHYNGLSATELKRMANAEKDKLKVDGFKGSLTGFGIPFTAHGDIVKLEDNEFPERSGAYFADKVKVSFGTSGFRRNIELGYKAQ